MIQIFQGNDSHYQQQYSQIKNILRKEHCIQLPQAKACDIYIYWSNADYFASGGVRLTLNKINHKSQYVVCNIAFHIDFDAYERDLENGGYSDFDAKIGAQFYKAIYLKLYDMVGKQSIQFSPQSKGVKQLKLESYDTSVPTLSNTQILMELSGEELLDCVNFGYWPCSQEQEIAEAHYRTTLSLTPQDRSLCFQHLNSVYIDTDNQGNE